MRPVAPPAVVGRLLARPTERVLLAVQSAVGVGRRPGGEPLMAYRTPPSTRTEIYQRLVIAGWHPDYRGLPPTEAFQATYR